MINSCLVDPKTMKTAMNGGLNIGRFHNPNDEPTFSHGEHFRCCVSPKPVQVLLFFVESENTSE